MIGKLIGTYQITAELAQGRLGPIYRGQSADQTREVVIKTINLTPFPASTQVQLKARYRREIFVQRQMQHGNIVQVYDFVQVEDKHFLVLEYVPGSSLRELLNRQGVPHVAQAVFLVKQALAALDYAHRFNYLDQSDFPRTGLIHGEIKPSNLLLEQRGRLRLTDFGVVNKVLTGGTHNPSASVYEQENDYLAPEQVRGMTPDACSDVYSLGVTFYEMLTGRVPFANWTASAALDVRRLNGEAEAQSLTQVRPDVPPQLALVIARAIKRNPKERFATAADFLRALQACEPQISSNELSARIDTLRGALRGTPANEDLPVVSPTAPPPPVSAAPASLVAPSVPPNPAALNAQPSMQILPPAREARPVRVEPIRRNSAGFPSQPTSALPRSVPVNVAPPQFAEISRPRREWWLVPVMVVSVLGGTLAGAYFFSSPSVNEGFASNLTRREGVAASVAPTLAQEPAEALGTPTASTPRSLMTLPTLKPNPVIPDSPLLDLARQAEQRESYTEAIKAYEDYLLTNPAAAAAPSARTRANQLRTFQTLVATAQSALAEARYSEAQQRFSEALKLRPTSKLAQSGLREAGAKLPAAQPNALISPASTTREPGREPGKDAPREVKGEVREDAGAKPDANTEKAVEKPPRANEERPATQRLVLPKPTPTPQS